MDAIRCAELAGDEPLAGTSARAAAWLCVEQPGPWGRDTPLESHLDDIVAHGLTELAEGTGVRIALIRRPGSHPDRHRRTARQVYLANTRPGATWLEHAEVTEPKDLLELDLAKAGAGVPGQLGAPISGPLLLICTNGRRDVCCALRGRPIAAALADHGDQVWECSHIGGHRFAPTAVVLPTGYSYGRLTTDSARHLLTGAMTTAQCRGRSTWTPPGQVAELAVRERIEPVGPDALQVLVVEETGDGGWLARVAHRDGRSWQVRIAERDAGVRSASCGAAPKPVLTLKVLGVREA